MVPFIVSKFFFYINDKSPCAGGGGGGGGRGKRKRIVRNKSEKKRENWGEKERKVEKERMDEGTAEGAVIEDR